MDMAIRRDRGLRRAARGFTIVELLVSVAIIGILSGLLLPAVQSARESARLTTCKSHISQIAKAMIRHETAMGHFPSGGWSPTWLGVAERPSDPSQPGGWTFGILPYAEELATRDLVADATALTAPSVYRQLATTPVRLFTCPSRRTSAPITVVGSGPFSSAVATGLTLTQATRSDYAANGGSVGNCPPLSVLKKVSGPVSNGTKITISHAPPGNPNNCQSLNLPYNAVVNAHLTPNHPSDRLGPCSGCSGSLDDTIYTPTSLTDGDAWRKATLGQKLALSDMGIPDLQDGFVHRMSRVTSAHILDGLTMSYLVGEKFMAADRYRTGTDAGDGAVLFAGYSSSNTRFGSEAPRQDERNVTAPTAFGGPHRAGFTIAFGDGSVRTIPYEIDPAVHKSLSARADGAVVTVP
jgi:prepilin-type N-terminal cleavage/methylation domain-containing protein